MARTRQRCGVLLASAATVGCAFAVLCCFTPAWGADFDIQRFGATPNDATDDTLAVRAAFEACNQAGGGRVIVPAGTYIVSRQKSESPILEIPSNTILQGDGAASVLKFDPRVNKSNFWRMLGASGSCSNIVIRDLRLDGSNTFPKYEPGKTPEHNHGVFLYAEKGAIENVTISGVLAENFSGDCIGIAKGCRNITVRDVTLRNFVRQGIQMAGGNGARDYLVAGCRDLEGTVEAGGSTIHVEHARGLQNVIIAANHCRRSILAGEVDGLIIRDNIITGRIEANANRHAIVQGNIVRGLPGKRALMQFGYADGLMVSGNILVCDADGATGIYVWGTSKYRADPSQHVSILDNQIQVAGQAISLNGVREALVHGNMQPGKDPQRDALLKRCERVVVDSKSGETASQKSQPSQESPAKQP